MIHPMKKNQKPNVAIPLINAARAPSPEIKPIIGLSIFQLNAAESTVRKSSIPVLSTAPCKVILSCNDEVCREKMSDRIKGFPDLPKVSRAECLLIVCSP